MIGKGGPLSTAYLRKQYYKASFNIVEPVEFMLDAKESQSFQYVSVLKSLQLVFANREVVDIVVKNHLAQQKSRMTSELKIDGSQASLLFVCQCQMSDLFVFYQ